ncbi:MAG: NYN domain-containing protein [Microcoleaceae cyanobacterium]
MKGTSVYLYIDYQNVKLKQSEMNNLISYAEAKGSLVSRSIYYNSKCPDQINLPEVFGDYDLKFIDVPCPLKNSADNQLIADCIQDASALSPNVLFIIVSGDGDFLSLVRTIRRLNNQVLVVARKGNVKQKLIECADEFCFIDQLPEPICSDLCNSSGVTYEEAVQCLFEAIYTAIMGGKCPEFSMINQLMRKNQNFPGYQGVFSILSGNGKKFARFKQFAESVAEDGLIGIKVQGKAQAFQLLQADLFAA